MFIKKTSLLCLPLCEAHLIRPPCNKVGESMPVCVYAMGVLSENNNSSSVKLHRGRGAILRFQTSRCESAGRLKDLGMCWIFPLRRKIIFLFQPE